MTAMIECQYCCAEFDPVATRWVCPECHTKNTCCEGAPAMKRLVAALVLIAALFTVTPPDLECVVRSLPYHCDPPPS